MFQNRGFEGRVFEMSLERIREIVLEACRNDTRKKEPMWWWDSHISKVREYALELAKEEGADAEIVEISVLLHDITKVRGEDIKMHHESGQREAERIMKEMGYEQDKIERVKHCIFSHRATQKIPRETIEAQCLADADAMSHFDIIDDLFYTAYVTEGLNTYEAKEWVRGKLERSWNKMAPKARGMAKQKYEASMLLLK